MHRNTYLLLIFLAVFAAVVVGVNLTRPAEQPTNTNTNAQALPVQTPTSNPESPNSSASYVLAGCGISFPYPATHNALEGPGNSVVFTSTTGEGSIIVTCQKDIPRPPLPADKIERLAFELPDKPAATFSATLYHDAQEKLIFKHPTKNLDIFISGTGASFQTLIRNLSILQ